MYPVLVDGDIIFIDSASKPKPGDIITFNYVKNTVLTHRLLSLNEIITKGDNVMYIDQAIMHEDILGVVKRVMCARKNKVFGISKKANSNFLNYARFEY